MSICHNCEARPGNNKSLLGACFIPKDIGAEMVSAKQFLDELLQATPFLIRMHCTDQMRLYGAT